MNRNLDLELVYFVIRRVTPKRFNVLCVYKQKDKRYKVTITSGETEEWITRPHHFIGGWNHEFLHVIIGEVVSYKASCKYDDYLKMCDLYDMTSLTDEWL